MGTVSDQGDKGTCSCHALGKSVVDGFQRGIFVPGRAVDFNQEAVIHVLLNEYKDGAGKILIQFDGKEYLLQDAERKYWTIKLSVERVEEEAFLDDIRSDEPDFTYVLSYSTDYGGRHAVYIQSCEYNVLHCINSWGNNQPNMKISLTKSGNNFYRIFRTTFIVLSSTGPSAEYQGGCLGVFEHVQQYNNSPAYRQRHTVAGTQPYYLYKRDGGDWGVGRELGDSAIGLWNT